MTADKYAKWIEEYRQEHGSFGRCKEAICAMREAFPELTEVAGHVEDAAWGRRAHWWLVAQDSIVDPTADQFPALYAYEPFEPGSEVRVGKCMHCGEELWAVVDSLDGPIPRRTFCNDECESAAIEELEVEIAYSRL